MTQGLVEHKLLFGIIYRCWSYVLDSSGRFRSRWDAFQAGSLQVTLAHMRSKKDFFPEWFIKCFIPYAFCTGLITFVPRGNCFPLAGNGSEWNLGGVNTVWTASGVDGCFFLTDTLSKWRMTPSFATSDTSTARSMWSGSMTTQPRRSTLKLRYDII